MVVWIPVFVVLVSAAWENSQVVKHSSLWRNLNSKFPISWEVARFMGKIFASCCSISISVQCYWSVLSMHWAHATRWTLHRYCSLHGITVHAISDQPFQMQTQACIISKKLNRSLGNPSRWKLSASALPLIGSLLIFQSSLIFLSKFVTSEQLILKVFSICFFF